MGLAASQCRLIFITLRQNDVSAKMQRISNDRLTLSRDEDDISTEYNRRLNATTYEMADGSTLSYSNLMGTNALNAGGSITTITDVNGRLVLDDRYFSALGIASNKTEGKESDFGVSKNKFISNMAGISEAKVQSYNNVDIKDFDTWISTDSLGKKAMKDAGFTETCPVPTESKNVTINSENDFYAYLNKYKLSDLTGESSGYYAGKNGGYVESNLFLDKIHSQGTSYSDGTTGQALFLGKDETQASTRITTIITNLMKKISSELGLSDSQQKTLLSSVSTVKGKGYSFGDSQHVSKDKSDRKDDSQCEKAIADACNSGQRAAWIFKKGDGNDQFFAINIKMLFDDTFSVIQDKLGSTNGTNLKFTIPGDPKTEEIKEWNEKAKELYNKYVLNQKPEGLSDSDVNKILFYEQIYDRAADGWVHDGNTDSSSLMARLANGSYLLNGANAENSGEIVPKKDQNEIDKAKVWYDAEMKKIERKEKDMDTKLAKYQTEYTALTNDYNSVKSIIDANVQKSFTYCQNG